MDPSNSSIFKTYPPAPIEDLITKESPVSGEGMPNGPITQAMNGLINFFREEPYVELPEGSSQRQQLDNLDANLSRRIHRVGEGVGILAVGIAASSELATQDASPATVTALIASTSLIGAGILRGLSAGRIDSERAINRYGSNARTLPNFVLSMISPRLYEKRRNRQLAKLAE